MIRSMLFRTVILLAGCTASGCFAGSDTEPLPVLCRSPLATYTIDVHWTSGNCQGAEDGDLDVLITEDGGEWLATSATWGMVGYLEIALGGDSCSLELLLAGSAGEHFEVSLDPRSMSGEGTLTINAADGSTCRHFFEVPNFSVRH